MDGHLKIFMDMDEFEMSMHTFTASSLKKDKGSFDPSLATPLTLTFFFYKIQLLR